jgi:hypothetical protein
MVDKRNRFLFFLFLLVSVYVHTYECFKVGREIFGIENAMPSGDNNESDNNKTSFTMQKTTIECQNTALEKVQITENKNPLIDLL